MEERPPRILAAADKAPPDKAPEIYPDGTLGFLFIDYMHMEKEKFIWHAFAKIFRALNPIVLRMPFRAESFFEMVYSAICDVAQKTKDEPEPERVERGHVELVGIANYILAEYLVWKAPMAAEAEKGGSVASVQGESGAAAREAAAPASPGDASAETFPKKLFDSSTCKNIG